MTAPPRTIERLLAGLGATPDFRNAVLGDLAEEFASRVDADGIERATRWYRREALRAVPHLLRSWLRGARLGDVGHLAGVIATAYTAMAVIVLILGGVTFGVARAIGYGGQPLPLSIGASTAILSCLMVFALGMGSLGGFLAAWLDSRAPLVTSTTFGALMLLVSFASQVILGRAQSRFPGWYLTGAPVLELVGAIVGGILYVRASWRANAQA